MSSYKLNMYGNITVNGSAKTSTIAPSKPDIEFRFIVEDEEYRTMFVMSHGFDIEVMNDSISADLYENQLIIEMPKSKFVQAFVSAFNDQKLRLSVANVSFALKPDTVQFSILEDMVVRVSVFIDPLSGKVGHVSTNRRK